MNALLDLRGPEFLRIYFGLMVLATATALILRWWFRRPADDAWIEEMPLDPYEVAYLKGGKVLAVNAALASLVHSKALVVDNEEKRLRTSKPPGPGTPELEQAVYRAIENLDGNVKELHKADGDLIGKLPSRLLDEGLVCSDETVTQVRWASFIPFAVVLVLGCLKILIGTERHRPVGLLILLCLVTGMVMVGFALVKPHRTRRGSRLLARLAGEHSSLHETATSLRGRTTLKPKDVALAMGIFGASVMANGSLRDLGLLLKPPAGTAGCGSGCGTGCGGGDGGGGCGGGGCGGGCGGCGG